MTGWGAVQHVDQPLGEKQTRKSGPVCEHLLQAFECLAHSGSAFGDQDAARLLSILQVFLLLRRVRALT